MKLQRIVGCQRNVEALLEIGEKRTARKLKKQLVVADWRHRNADLRQIKEILQNWSFPQSDSMIDVFRQQKGGRQMIDWPCERR